MSSSKLANEEEYHQLFPKMDIYFRSVIKSSDWFNAVSGYDMVYTKS